MKIKSAKTIIKKHLTEQIKVNLELNEMNGEDLQDILCTDKTSVSRWRTGRSMPSLPAALALADALGITVDRLLTGEDGELL